MFLMGLDVGTTGVKAAVFTEDGQLQGYGFEEYDVRCPLPGYAEQDAEAVFAAAKRVMRQAAAPIHGEIKAIGLSVQGDAVVPVDAQFKALSPVHLGMDYRCVEQAHAFAKEFGDQPLFQRTGMRPHPLNSLCKVRYFTEQMKPIDDQARYYMTYADYIISKLGADEPVIDLTMASRTMGMRIDTLDWDDELIRSAGVTRDRLSRPVSSGTAVGELSAPLCAELGIAKGALLVTGGHDQPCAALGAGLIRPDLALDSHGTAEVISTAFAECNTSDVMYEANFPCYAHVVPGMFFTFSLNHAAGILLKWFVEGFCEADAARAREKAQSVYGLVLEQVKDEPSPLIALPYFNGKGTPAWDLAAKGMLMGLTLSTTRFDVARAIVEANCFDMRENLEAFQGAGVKIESLRAVGGGAKSEIGLQLKADITGLPVHTLAIREAACLGAAMLAGLAAGAYKDAREASEIVRLEKCYAPRPDMRRRYAERYLIYRELYRVNREIMRAM